MGWRKCYIKIMATPRKPKSELKSPGRKQFDGKDEETVLQLLRDGWAMDLNDEECSAHAGISAAALSVYLKNNPEFLKQKTRLKENSNIKTKKTIHDNLHDPKVAMWRAERRMKDDFATKQVIDDGRVEKLDNIEKAIRGLADSKNDKKGD